MTEVPFQGKASLADLATTKEGKEALKKRNWKEVVVYDDSSEDLSSLPYSHTLFLVIKSLVDDLRKPIMLTGGIRCFQVSLGLAPVWVLFIVIESSSKCRWRIHSCSWEVFS